MTIPVARRVLGSWLKATISSTLTKIPGIENLKIDPGEKERMMRQDLEQPYVNPTSAGTFTEQTMTFDLIWDPLDAVHQFLAASFNPDADPEDDTSEIVGEVGLGQTGQEVACKFMITKFPIDLSKGAGMKVAVECVFTEQFLIPETDPS